MRIPARGLIASAICLAALAATETVQAQQQAGMYQQTNQNAQYQYQGAYNQGAQPATFHHHSQYNIAGQYCPPGNAFGGYGGGPEGTALGAPGGRYPQLDASLYPCPRQDIPAEVGGTLITNAALYPHEMLYEHKYKALYPPYYYRTTWRYGYRWTNCRTFLGFSVPTLERVKIATKTKAVGTCVKVEYKSHISPLSLFWPPNSWGDWRYSH
jgi:hypothetical protein